MLFGYRLLAITTQEEIGVAKNIDVDKTTIKKLRVNQKHTQESLALEIGVSRRAISCIENTGSTSKQTAEKLAKAFGVSFNYLTGDDESEFLPSPFYCELLESGSPSQQARSQLFNSETELLAFLDQQINQERPFRIGGRIPGEYSDFPTKSLPTYSIEGVNCTLRIPLREEEPDPEANDGRILTFTFRELRLQTDVGLTWQPLRKWTSIYINQNLSRTLNKYYPEYIFLGEHRGNRAQFLVVLSDEAQQVETETLLLEGLWPVRQFATWFSHHLPPLAASKIPSDNRVSFRLSPGDHSLPERRIDILRIDPVTETKAPFPEVWKESLITALSWSKSINKSGTADNSAMPTLEEFSHLNRL